VAGQLLRVAAGSGSRACIHASGAAACQMRCVFAGRSRTQRLPGGLWRCRKACCALLARTHIAVLLSLLYAAHAHEQVYI
jgi:hypothetical protein